MGFDGNIEVLALIPVRGRDAEVDGAPIMLAGKPLIAYTIQAALTNPVVKRTMVTTDSNNTRNLAVDLGAESPVLRPGELAGDDVSLDQVLQHCLAWLAEHEGYRPDIVATNGKQKRIIEVETPDSVNSARDVKQQEAFRNAANRSDNATFRRTITD